MSDDTFIFVTIIFLVTMIVVSFAFADFLYCVAFLLATTAVIHICGIPK